MSLSFSTLKAKLDRLGAKKREELGTVVPAPPMAKPTRTHPLEGFITDLLPEDGERGRVYVQRLTANHHPVLRTEAPNPTLPATASTLLGVPEDLDIRQVCFVDTETTGLMGATGTTVFQAGIGWWENHNGEWRFQLELYLIEDFCDEGELVRRLGQAMAPFKAVVTYNGKSYDMPLLRARSVMNRISPATFQLPQFDLLGPSRRLWKSRLSSVSLKSVEANILEIDRGPDIEGSLIPAMFFALAQEGKTEGIEKVLHHNAQDIASLAALLEIHLAVAMDPVGNECLSTWQEWAAVARWMTRLKDHESAIGAYDKALALAPKSTVVETELLFLKSILYKRTRCYEEAVSLWHNLRHCSHREAFDACVELTKYYEHVARDLPSAMVCVSHARTRLSLWSEMRSYGIGSQPAWTKDLEAELDRRAERLTRKMTSKES